MGPNMTFLSTFWEALGYLLHLVMLHGKETSIPIALCLNLIGLVVQFKICHIWRSVD